MLLIIGLSPKRRINQGSVCSAINNTLFVYTYKLGYDLSNVQPIFSVLK